MPRRQNDRGVPAVAENTLPAGTGPNRDFDWRNFGVIPEEERETSMAELNDMIDSRLKRIETDFIKLGRELLVAYNNRIWEFIPELNSWSDFCEFKNISESKASDLINMHIWMIPAGITEEQIARIGIAKARMILPRIRDGADPEDLAQMAENTGWRGLLAHFKALKAGDEPPDQEEVIEPIRLRVDRRNGHFVCTFEVDTQDEVRRVARKAHFDAVFD